MSHFATVAATALFLAGLGSFAGDASAFTIPNHEAITAEALSFVRSGVLDDIENEHADWADDDWPFSGTAADVKWVHVDSCAFGETVQQVNAFYHDAVVNLVAGPTFDPWSATDDFGIFG